MPSKRNDNNDKKFNPDMLINTRICNEDAAKYSQKSVAAHTNKGWKWAGYVCTRRKRLSTRRGCVGHASNN